MSKLVYESDYWNFDEHEINDSSSPTKEMLVPLVVQETSVVETLQNQLQTPASTAPIKKTHHQSFRQPRRSGRVIVRIPKKPPIHISYHDTPSSQARNNSIHDQRQYTAAQDLEILAALQILAQENQERLFHIQRQDEIKHALAKRKIFEKSKPRIRNHGHLRSTRHSGGVSSSHLPESAKRIRSLTDPSSPNSDIIPNRASLKSMEGSSDKVGSSALPARKLSNSDSDGGTKRDSETTLSEKPTHLYQDEKKKTTTPMKTIIKWFKRMVL